MSTASTRECTIGQTARRLRRWAGPSPARWETDACRERSAALQDLADLFQNGGDPVEVIKWKEVYGLLESTIDKCEDVANIIERIVVKSA